MISSLASHRVGHPNKRLERRTMNIFLLVIVLLISACARQPQPPRVEEITFKSGSFTLVGDLRLPAGVTPFPVVLFVHGGGTEDRRGNLSYLPIMDRMLQAGYATFAWDKPGVGESTGIFSDTQIHSQRAQILLDAIEVMKQRTDIDPKRIGLWGVSQAGYVMPRALAKSKDIAFMICVSCPGMPGYDQMAFQVVAEAFCKELPLDKVEQKTALLAELDKARSYKTYADYLHYRGTLNALAALLSEPVVKWQLLPERSWDTNPLSPEGLWNPMQVIAQSKIPILAVFGDQDRALDPFQGAIAFRDALKQSGNPKSRVEVFPGANHSIVVSETGCQDEQQKVLEKWLEQWVQSLGNGDASKAQAIFEEDPYKAGLFSSFPFAPGYLDLIERWLRELQP